MPERVPLVVLTGFLGAGKTTLLNALLAARAARGQGDDQLAVVVNELGEVGIDGALLGGEGPRQIELPGGCVCCVLGDELDDALVDLVARNPRVAAIVLETTGVAEPLPIAWAVTKAGSRVAERVRLAAVVTLVDASAFRAVRAETAGLGTGAGPIDAQVAYADAVLVTKSALAGEAETAAVEAEVRRLAPRAPIVRGDLPAHTAWLEELLAEPSLEGLAHVPHGAPGHVHDASCRHGDSGAHGIDSVWTDVPGEVDLEELEDQLAELPSNYVRIKGIVRAVDARGGSPVRGWFACHRVGLRVSSAPAAPPRWASGRMVALGPGVRQSALAACIAAAGA